MNERPSDGRRGLSSDRMQGDLERELLQGLRARYVPPTGLGARLRAAVEGAASPSGGATAPAPSSGRGGAGGGGQVLRRLAPLAAAALVLVLFLPRAPRLQDEGAEPLRIASRMQTAALEDCAPREGPRLDSPDLATLYHEVVASAGSPDGRDPACESRAAGDSLLATLRERHGTGLRASGDAQQLAGPFPFEGWRGGTVLAGFPEGGGMPSVLVAESTSELDCCIDLKSPRDPDLNVFTWPVGDTVLLEITREERPRFLDRFE